MQNFIMKVAVLYLSFSCNRLHFEISRKKGLTKICLASGAGTIFEIAGLILANNYNLFLILVHFLEIPVMFICLVGRRMDN